MGHRIVKRVPMDFDAPLNKTWPGFLMPDFHRDPCPTCSPGTIAMGDKFRGFGDGQTDAARAILFGWWEHELRRYTYKGQNPTEDAFAEAATWHNKLGQAEIDWIYEHEQYQFTRHVDDPEAEHGRRREKIPKEEVTAERVNAAQTAANKPGGGMFQDFAVADYVALRARCALLAIETSCATCEGHGLLMSAADRAAEEAWEPTEPPTGPGWQLWKTTSEGSPQTPVFATPEELAAYCEVHCTMFASMKATKEEWLSGFVHETTDVDSLLVLTMPAQKDPLA